MTVDPPAGHVHDDLKLWLGNLDADLTKGVLLEWLRNENVQLMYQPRDFVPWRCKSGWRHDFLYRVPPTHTTPHSLQSFQHLFGVHWQVHTFGPVQFGIRLLGSSWEDVKLIRGTTCVLAGRPPPSPGSGRRLPGHRPVGIRHGGCLLHERAFSLEFSSPGVCFLP